MRRRSHGGRRALAARRSGVGALRRPRVLLPAVLGVLAVASLAWWFAHDNGTTATAAATAPTAAATRSGVAGTPLSASTGNATSGPTARSSRTGAPPSPAVPSTAVPSTAASSAGRSPASVPMAPAVVGTVLFPPGSAVLDADGLRAVATATAGTRTARALTVRGYTSTVGETADNLTLSRERAHAVAARLRVLLGPSAPPIRVLALGEQDPVADADTADGRRLDRRATISTG